MPPATLYLLFQWVIVGGGSLQPRYAQNVLRLVGVAIPMPCPEISTSAPPCALSGEITLGYNDTARTITEPLGPDKW